MFEEQDPREPLPHLCPRLHFLDGDRHLAGTRTAHHRVEGSTSIKFTKECPSLLSRGRCEFHCELADSMYGFTTADMERPPAHSSSCPESIIVLGLEWMIANTPLECVNSHFNISAMVFSVSASNYSASRSDGKMPLPI